MQELDESPNSHPEPQEDTVNNIVDFFRALSELRESTKAVLKEWVTKREQTILTLKQLAESLHQHHRNSHIATATGAGVATTSFGLVLDGFIAAFFTAGAGLIVSAVGAGLGAAGRLTMTGSKIAEYILSKVGLQEVEQALHEDKKSNETLRESFDRVDQFFARNSAFICRNMTNQRLLEGFGINEILEMFPGGLKSSKEEQKQDQDTRDIARHLLRNIGAGVTVSTSAAAVSAGRVAINTLSVAARAAHIAGFATSAALLPLDIYVLVKSLIELHKGSTSEVVTNIRQKQDELTSSCPSEEEVPEVVPQYVQSKFFKVLCDYTQPATPETED